ncbi:MAG: hypothetical protein ACUVUC_01910 [Thermoguttaceae bacterium]
MADEILRELWRVKEEMARNFNYDLDALVAHLRNQTARSGRVAVDRGAAQRPAEQDDRGGMLAAERR